jgi:hypothetical protein
MCASLGRSVVAICLQFLAPRLAALTQQCNRVDHYTYNILFSRISHTYNSFYFTTTISIIPFIYHLRLVRLIVREPAHSTPSSSKTLTLTTNILPLTNQNCSYMVTYRSSYKLIIQTTSVQCSTANMTNWHIYTINILKPLHPVTLHNLKKNIFRSTLFYILLVITNHPQSHTLYVTSLKSNPASSILTLHSSPTTNHPPRLTPLFTPQYLVHSSYFYQENHTTSPPMPHYLPKNPPLSKLHKIRKFQSLTASLTLETLQAMLSQRPYSFSHAPSISPSNLNSPYQIHYPPPNIHNKFFYSTCIRMNNQLSSANIHIIRSPRLSPKLYLLNQSTHWRHCRKLIRHYLHRSTSPTVAPLSTIIIIPLHKSQLPTTPPL